MALRFEYERTKIKVCDAWNSRFIKPFYKRLLMNNIHVYDIVQGLNFCRTLDLPSELSFNASHMKDIMISKDCQRPLSYMR